MTTHGMCVFCTFNAAAPGEDLCRDCLDLRTEQRRQWLEVINTRSCQFGVAWCTPFHPCGDCAEFASYGADAA